MTALAGLKIVDFSRFLPGAYVSWLAADLGAQVTRIKHPREAAKQRAMLGDDPLAAIRPTWLRNKRTLTLNPGNAVARDVILKLIDGADILIEDYRPGVLASMGYAYDECAARNPRLIYVSASFAGQTGPYRDQPGHDPAALALAGALGRLNGTSTPTLPGAQVADVLAGAHATIAMLAALQARTHTGRGQQVDVAMTDAAMPLIMVALGRAAPEDIPPTTGAWHPKGGVWQCADGGWICTTDMEPAYWSRFCTAVGRPDFEPLRTQPSEWPRVHAELTTIFRTRPRDEWIALLHAAGTQAMPLLTPAEALTHPHNRARGMAVEIEAEGQTLHQIGTPFHLSDTPSVPPCVSEDATDAILAELGYDRATLDAAGAFSSERA